MTSLRNEETEVQKVQYDLSKVTQAVNDRVILKFPVFYFIMRFRDVPNAMFHYEGKKIDLSFFYSNSSDRACLTISFFN